MAVPLGIPAKTLIKKEDAYRDKIKGKRSLKGKSCFTGGGTLVNVQ